MPACRAEIVTSYLYEHGSFVRRRVRHRWGEPQGRNAWERISQSFRSISGKSQIVVLTSVGTATIAGRMSKAEKLFEKLMSAHSDANFPFDDLCVLLTKV